MIRLDRYLNIEKFTHDTGDLKVCVRGVTEGLINKGKFQVLEGKTQNVIWETEAYAIQGNFIFFKLKDDMPIGENKFKIVLETEFGSVDVANEKYFRNSFNKVYE